MDGKSLRETLIEVGKWGLVIFLLLPLKDAQVHPIDVWRIVIGVLLFVIFSGKLLYDVILADIMKRRRQSLKKDVVTLIGMALAAALVVGLLILFSGWLFVRLMQQSQPGGV